MKFLKNKTILITGGTGSFGKAATKYILTNCQPKKIIIFSRDENKQYEMQNQITNKKIRFFIGDIRDEKRLDMALRNVDYVINAAAMKQVPASEYNPFECIQTNIHGSQSIINASIRNKVKKIISLSTDKACNPINLYGATKLCAEKLFVNANQYSINKVPTFSCVRYGNVIASRGSVIPYFKNLILKGKKELPLTHPDMTRFFISLEDAVKFVLNSMNTMKGGEIFIPKMSSIYIKNLIKILNPRIKIKIVGIRPGEKIHEMLCSNDESKNLYESKGYFTIHSPYLNIKPKGKRVKKNFSYVSNLKQFLNENKIRSIMKKNKV